MLKCVSRETNEVVLCCLGEEWTRRGCLAVDWHEENFSRVIQATFKVRYSIPSPHVFILEELPIVIFYYFFCSIVHTLSLSLSFTSYTEGNLKFDDKYCSALGH